MRAPTVTLVALVGLFGCTGEEPVQPDPAEQPLLIEAGGVVECLSPGLRETEGPMAARGTSPSPPNSDFWIWGGGVISADLNLDGYLDILTPNELGVDMYLGSAGGFEKVEHQVLEGIDLSYATGGSVVDYDGDGDLDLYITRFVGERGPPQGDGNGRNRLLRNDGNLTFVDVTDEAKVDGCGPDPRTGEVACYKSMSSSWADFDHDGDLDLFIGAYGWVDETEAVETEEFQPAEPSFLYENLGDGTFKNLSAELPVEAHDGYTYVSAFRDLNNDGWADIYVVNDFGVSYPNVVLWNDHGKFVLGDGSEGLSGPMTGMGLAFGDLNGDGWPEVAVPEWNKWSLLESRPGYSADGDGVLKSGKGLWIDYGKTPEKGLIPDESRDQKVPWGAEFADMDNDGDLDLMASYGFVHNENSRWSNPRRQPDALYLNEPVGDSYGFRDVGHQWRIDDDVVGRGLMLADFNNDGFLDIAKRDLDGPNVIFMSQCGLNRWLRVSLRQPGTMNVFSLEATVIVTLPGGKKLRRQVFSGGTSIATGGPPEVHFGLAGADTVEVRIIWPDGSENTVKDIQTNQQVRFTRILGE